MVLRWLSLGLGFLIACQQVASSRDRVPPAPSSSSVLVHTAGSQPVRDVVVPTGSVVTVLEIAPQDALASLQSRLRDVPCVVQAPGLGFVELGYVSGEIHCGPTREGYRLDRAQVEVLLRRESEEKVAASAGQLFSGKSLAEGAVIKVLSIQPKDRYFSQKSSLIGVKCVVDKAGMTRDREGFYGGAVLCGSTKIRYYFFQIELEVEYTSLMRTTSYAHGTDR
jgi:hypothetical protein